MKTRDKNLQEYYMTCKDYFVELDKKDFDFWFSAYHSTLRGRNRWILDVGCGTGQVVDKFTHENLDAVGIDISPIGIRIASKRTRGIFRSSRCK
ncbi:MAG: class I SAM-dependent methyltransferase [Candidatus Bathyarchaeota archaeon]|nr:class I SAM-dependent methyltransferase [Candidatus Bathyarchaeota archaeon]MDH5788549.1 class I SAM-dependent methyltransferase [Candidatus Bathyarchaeota archaeon]